MLDLADRTYLLPLSSVVPPHGVTDPAHRDAIAASMAEGGWQGRPLLVVEAPGGGAWVALTGSHRLAAARKAGLEEVEAVVVEGDALALHGEAVVSAATGQRLADLSANAELGALLRDSDPVAYDLLSEEP